MEIKILKGTKQIGGVFTEITSKRSKIIIDFGSDLDNVKRLEQIEGLTTGEKAYDGVVITHNHQDHMGRIDEIMENIDVYMSDLSRNIYETVYCFSKTKGKIKRKTIDMQDRKSFWINNDIKITPYIVDHSAYNSFMILIEADGERILHTGDFRDHGYKGVLLKPTLKEIGKIDVLITEGTTLSRPNLGRSKTELQLVDEIVEKTKDYKQVLMLMSTTNIDRVTTMQKAANRARKTVIHDIVLTNVLQLVTDKIPNALNAKDVFVFLPMNNYLQKDKEEYKKYITPYQEKIDMAGRKLHGEFMMNIRVSMLKDVERLKPKVLDNACIVYSMWEGYKTKSENYKKFIDRMKELKIDVIDLHVSGHADREAIQEVIDITNPDAVVPIHTEKPDEIKKFTDKAVILEDMEVYKIK